MEEKQSGIVLGGFNFGENDKILKVLTLEEGVVSARIKGVKKAGAKLKFAAEPFSFVEYVFSIRSDKRTVIGASLIDSFYPIRENIEKYFCASAVVEFINKFYRENMQTEEAFYLTINVLKEIAYGDNHLQSLVKYFINILSEAGYALKLHVCEECEGEIHGKVFFDYRRGGFFCEGCYDGVGREINADTFLTLNKIDGDQTAERESIKRALKLLSYYIENKAEEKLSSLDELIKILI